MLADVVFETVKSLPSSDLAGFYQRQEHPTPARLEKLERMMEHTLCFVTARRQGELIGIARGVTDGVWGRLAECKLDPKYQGPACITRTDGRIEHDSAGIAREMALRVIEALKEHGVERIDALAYGTEVDFCEELGFKKMPGVVAMQLALPQEGAEA